MLNKYFYVQCQPFCIKKSYCDFFVWTEQDIHIERVHPDKEFWLANVSHVKYYFVTAVLPELFGKFYSRTSQPVATVASEEPCCSGLSASLINSEDGNNDSGQCYALVLLLSKAR